MEIKQLEAFVATVKYKSFSKAADEIFLTQPTISAHIKSLENEVGPILDRSSREIVPCGYGDTLYKHAVEILNIREKILSESKGFTNAITGKLEIAASTVPAQYILPTYLTHFQEIFPEVTVNMMQADSQDAIEKLLSGMVEIAIVGSITADDLRLSAKPFLEDELVLITPNKEEYGIEALGDDPFSALLKKPFIIREAGSGTRKEFEKILRDKGIAPETLQVSGQMNSTQAVKNAVAQGMGISVISSIAAGDYEKFGMIRTVKIKGEHLKRQFYMITHKNRFISPTTERFIQFILDKEEVENVI